MKKILLILLLGILVGGGVFIFLQLRQKPVMSSTLSDRAKEYLTEQKNSDNAQWRSVQFTNKHTSESDLEKQTIDVGKCFSIVIPFQIIASNLNQVCSAEVKIDSPRGLIVVSQAVVHFDSLEDSPDIVMRGQRTATYSKNIKLVQGNSYSIFTNIQEPYEKTAFTMRSGKYLTLSMKANTNENFDEKFMKMLSSIRYK